MKFNYDSPVMRFLARLTDLVTLQILFLVTSIPVITIGAGLTSLYATSRKLWQDSATSVIVTYFHEFKAAFRQSTLAWLIFLAAGALLTLDILYYSRERGGINTVMLVGAGVIAAVVYLDFLYVFPLMAWFDNKLGAQLKNALILSVTHLLTTVTVTILFGAAILIGLNVFILAFFMGISGMTYLAAWFFGKAFAAHIPNNDKEE